MTITGTLTDGSAQAAVYLWQKLAGQGGFTRIAQTTTNSAGGYTFVRGDRVLKTNAAWYTSAAGAFSPTLMQGVRAKVKFRSLSITGMLATLNGHVSPSHRGERIWLERYSTARRWKTVASSMIGRWSNFTVRHRFARSGNVLLRAVFGGDARNLRSRSAPLRIALT